GKGQQAQSPVVVLQQVLSSGQEWVESQETFLASSDCFFIAGTFSSHGTEPEELSHVSASALQVVP
ncbi:hypothetical protein GN956_G27299, partial [Arapaima gigas]